MEYKSGIQRVVDNIIRELNKKTKKFNISYFYFPRIIPQRLFIEYDIKRNITLKYFPKEGDIIFF